MKLSILICTIPARDKLLEALMEVLRPSLPPEYDLEGNMQTEVIVAKTMPQKYGGPNIGAKRQELLDQAGGDYIVYVDDDDMVCDDYVPKILAAIADKPDVVGIKGLYYEKPDAKPSTFIHSLKFHKWETVKGVYQRCPNHLNPVRRNLALKAGFNEKLMHGEDMEYSMALRPLLNTEVMIEEPCYFYYPKASRKL
jgi:glycosyltransferase involved in cell wall biosynthesis